MAISQRDTNLALENDYRRAKNHQRYAQIECIQRGRPVVSEVVCYELPASCFPRYKYFRDLLQRFLPRFQRTIEHGKLPEFTKSDNYACIREDSNKFGNIIYVYLETKNDTKKDMFEKDMVKSNPTEVDSVLVKRSKVGTYDFTSTEEFKDNIKYSARINLQKPYRNTLKYFFLDDFAQITGAFFEYFYLSLHSLIEEIEPKLQNTILNSFQDNIKPVRLSRANKYDFKLTFESELICQTNDALTSICLQQQSSDCFQCNLPQNTVWYSVNESEICLYTADGEKHEGRLGDLIQQFLEGNVVALFENILDFTKNILREDHDPDNSELTRVIQSVERLQFEVLGILRQSSLDLKDTTPRNPVVTNAMKKDIMKLPGVIGCGTVLGMFTIFFSGKCKSEKDVKAVLNKYKFNHKYRINTETELSKCAVLYHGSGNVIRAKRKPPYQDNEKYGTLGCFVKLKQKSKEETAEDQNDLYFITCGHCVHDYQDVIDINAKEQFIPFGKTQYTLYDGNLVRDIAFVEVLPHCVKDCDKSIFRSCGSLSAKNWNFFEESVPDGLPVYKVGASSNITQGVVVSANDLSFVCEEGQHQGSVENLVFIIPVETLENQESFFSESGDSGSIVCTDDRDHVDRVKVVSLLSGNIKATPRSDGQESQVEHRELSYSFHLQNAIRDAEEEHDFRAEPAVDEEDGEEGATGGIRRLF